MDEISSSAFRYQANTCHHELAYRPDTLAQKFEAWKRIGRAGTDGAYQRRNARVFALFALLSTLLYRKVFS